MRTLLSVVVLAMALGACGGSDDAVSSTTAPTAPVTTDMSRSGTVSSTGVDPCDLLSADEVAEATGFEVVEVVPTPPVACLYDFGEDVPVDIFVAIEDGQGRMAGAASVFDDYGERSRSGDTIQVPGLGSIAYFDGNYRAVAVDAGDGRYFVVGVNGTFGELSEPRDTLVALADLALLRL